MPSPDENVIAFPAASAGGQELPKIDEKLLAALKTSPLPPAASQSEGIAAAGPASGRRELVREDRNLGESRPWLTLAAIVGNEGHHIGRFLAAFEPLVDEVVLVRAVGGLDPDDTFDIARELVTGKPLRLAEYENAPNVRDWPHVDHFANARQMAFNLARGEFVMWADCDDIIAPDQAEKLRAAVDLGNFDCLFMHYRVVGAPPLMRERVIRRSINYRWVNAVHEAISLPQGIVPMHRPDLEVFHLPMRDRNGEEKANRSLERNLRILNEQIGPAALQYFYLHRDYLLKGDVKLAVEWGKLALQVSTLTPAERYRVLYNMAKIFLDMGDFGQAETFCLNGLRQEPSRRECFCIMAHRYIAGKDWARALTWIQLAKCIVPPPPKARPNWYEESWYGWQADLANAFILRKMGHAKEALDVEDSEHGGKPMFSLLHATRGRPEKALHARDQWFRAAVKPGMIEHIFAVDADDTKTLEELDGMRVVVVEPGGGCVRAWNAAAKESRGHVLVQMSDDWLAPHHWDNAVCWKLKDPIEKKLPGVLAIDDGHRKDKLLCMAILTRAYYLRQRHEKTGEPYLFHPDYLGVYSDNEFTVRAYENGVVIDARDLRFIHNHPFFTGEAVDEVYAAQNAAERYEHGLAVFNRRNPRYKIEPAPVTV